MNYSMGKKIKNKIENCGKGEKLFERSPNAEPYDNP